MSTFEALQEQETVISVAGEIRLRSTAKVIVRVVEWRGAQRVDIRTYFLSEDGWKATGKGVRFKPSAWPELKKVFEKLDADVAKLGIR